MSPGKFVIDISVKTNNSYYYGTVAVLNICRKCHTKDLKNDILDSSHKPKNLIALTFYKIVSSFCIRSRLHFKGLYRYGCNRCNLLIFEI